MIKRLSIVFLFMLVLSCGTYIPPGTAFPSEFDVYVDKDLIGKTPANFSLNKRQSYKVTYKNYPFDFTYNIKVKSKALVVFKLEEGRPAYTNLTTGETVFLIE